MSSFLYTLYPITRTNTANNPTFIGQQINQFSSPGVSPYFLGWETLNGIDYIVLTNVVKSLVSTSYDNAVFTDRFEDVVNFPTGTDLYIGTIYPTDPKKFFATTSGPATFLKDLGKSRYYISLARKVARSQIKPVGGDGFSGPSRAVWEHNGSPYAIRDRANDNEARLFVAMGGSDPQSWLELDLGYRIYFQNLASDTLKSDATVTLIEGDHGGVPPASPPAIKHTCTVRTVVIMGGTIGAGDAFGYFSTDYIENGAFYEFGTPMRADGITVAVTPVSGGGYVTAPNTLPANGDFRMKRWNFTGVKDNVRMYGISTVGTAFEIWIPSGYGNPGGIIFTPIITGQGLTTATFNYDAVGGGDTPNRIEVSHDHLWLAYPGGNVSHSGYQTPGSWTVLKGADQRYLGDDVTNMIGNINNTMIITTKNRLRIMYGDVLENFQLRDLNTEAGAYANTAQPIGGVCFLTDEGINFYDQSANFGNYAGNSLSQAINSLLKAYMQTGVGALEAAIQRDHSFYRLYFSKGVCFTLCIVGKELKGLGKCEYALGSTLSLSTDTGSGPIPLANLPVGTTITNWDKSESCKIFQVRRILGDPDSIDTVIVTDTQVTPEKWVKDPLYQSNVYVGTTLVGIAGKAEVNTPSHFWSASSTITPGNHDTPPPE
ncbi:MAG TPA: hypothetical protein VNG73_04490, partial [Gemmatimonadaceae bacterium]|nr:hypothetical protein [Gemmatimonadaceae bacterium]